MTTTTKEELKHHVTAKKHELQAKMEQLKKEGSDSANDKANEISKKLKEVEEIVSNGWDNISDSAVEKLNQWLR